MDSLEQQDNFFGRKDILDLLKKRFLGLKEGYRQNIALLGGRYVGKTTILRKFISDFDDPDIDKIYIDLDCRDINCFFTVFMGSILLNYARRRGLNTHADLSLLIETTKSDIPETVKAIKKIQSDLSHNRSDEAYQHLIDLPNVYTNETGRFCAVFLDEFQNLDDFSISDVYKKLGKKIMTQKKTLYIVTSSYPELTRKILSEKLSLLFGNFEVVGVDFFDLKTSQEFIEYSLDGINMGVTLKNFLIDFTAGHPLYLNLILRELTSLSLTHKQTDVFSPLLVQAIENTIFDQWGALSRHFEIAVRSNSAVKGNQIVPSLLIALANNKYRIRDLVKVLEIKQGVLKQKLNRLLETGLIERNGSFYFLNDKLLRYWIKYVYHKRMNTIEYSSEKIRKDFLNEVNYSIHDFKQNSRKELSSRIVELLYCFDNESINISGRKYKLPIFSKIESTKLENISPRNFDVIKARTDQGDWFIVLKRERFGENDVHAFIRESKKLTEKPARCVIISMSDLDQNAKLRALQERVWVWNEREVNTLLNLYNKSFIV